MAEHKATVCLATLLLLSTAWLMQVECSKASAPGTTPVHCRDHARRTQPSSLQQAQHTCHLEIVGFGKDIPGVKRVRLNCTSPPGEPPVQVGVASDNATACAGSPLSPWAPTVWQELKQHAVGVKPVRGLGCQYKAEKPKTAASLVPLYALLYFCSGNILFLQPVVSDLFLPYTVADRAQEDTAPVAFGGNASVEVTGARVQWVNASTTFAVIQDANLTITDSAFFYNDGNPGSAVFAKERSSVLVRSSRFKHNNSSDYGGALALFGRCHVVVANSILHNNTAKYGGGAIYAAESSKLTLINSTLSHNQAGTVGGGAVLSDGLLSLCEGTSIKNNNASGNGGGVLMRENRGSRPELQVSPDSSLTDNVAKAYGGGLATGGGVYMDGNVKFSPQALNVTVRDNKAVRDDDVGVQPDVIDVLNETNVVGYVSRPGDQRDLLTVQLKVSGIGGLPCGVRKVVAVWASQGKPSSVLFAPGGRRLHAGEADAAGAAAPVRPACCDHLDDMPQAMAMTSPEGIVTLDLTPSFKMPPGTHSVCFKVDDVPYDVVTDINVTVRSCLAGEEPRRPGECRVCAAHEYNFQPGSCTPCPEHATCPGGDVVLSAPGFWQSSPRSSQIHRCPNPDACKADRNSSSMPCSLHANSSSLSRLTATAAAPGGCVEDASRMLKQPKYGSDFAEQQCQQGYGGNLCGRCAQGFGSSRPFHCRHCLSKGRFIATYVVASLLLFAVMYLLCWLTRRESQTALVKLRRRAAQARPTPQPSQPRAPSSQPQVAGGAAAAPSPSLPPPPPPSCLSPQPAAPAACSDGAAVVDEPEAEASHLLRQLVLHGQYTLIVASVQAADSWPATIARPLQALSWVWAPASPGTLAPDCVVWYAASTMSPAIAKVVFYLATPLALMILLLLVEVCVAAAKGRLPFQQQRSLQPSRRTGAPTGSGFFTDKLLATGMVVVFFFLPSIVRTAFGLFACISIDAPKSLPEQPLAVGKFWVLDTNQLCFEGWHTPLAGVLGSILLLFVGAVLVFILWKTLPYRNSLSLNEVPERGWLEHYGFLVLKYKPRFCFWEAVVAAETMMLVALSVFSYTLGPYYQALMMNVAVAFIALVLAAFRPLLHKEAQQVALAGMACLYITSYSALTFAQTAGRSGGSIRSGSSEVHLSGEVAAIPLFMGVVVVVVNLLYVSWVLWRLSHLVEWRRHWQSVCDTCACLAHICSTAARVLSGRRRRPARFTVMQGTGGRVGGVQAGGVQVGGGQVGGGQLGGGQAGGGQVVGGQVGGGQSHSVGGEGLAGLAGADAVVTMSDTDQGGARSRPKQCALDQV